MRIGLINELHGNSGADEYPTWASIALRAATAEQCDFDIFVFEDALLYRGESSTDGCWESMAIAAALAAVTDRMEIGQSVVNSPYRSPAMTAAMAETIHEISGGRYDLGIGAGNTADTDYQAFGFPTDHRYSRFAEAIEIIHTLLRTGKANFHGTYYSARDAELALRGPGGSGPPITIAAGGVKMLQLAARYGDRWNWWIYGETLVEARERIGGMLNLLDDACASIDRDPSTLTRTLDLYTVVAPGHDGPVPGMDSPVTGTEQQIADYILGLGDLGISEVRCDVWPRTDEAISAMGPVVDLVHRG